MGVDRETVPRYVNIVLDDSKKYLGVLRARAEADGQNAAAGEEGKPTKLSLTDDDHSFTTEEYYFDDEDNHLTITGILKTAAGESFVSISLPLSDIVFIDIIAGAIKRLNKLKTAMESLK